MKKDKTQVMNNGTDTESHVVLYWLIKKQERLK